MTLWCQKGDTLYDERYLLAVRAAFLSSDTGWFGLPKAAVAHGRGTAIFWQAPRKRFAHDLLGSYRRRRGNEPGSSRLAFSWKDAISPRHNGVPTGIRGGSPEPLTGLCARAPRRRRCPRPAPSMRRVRAKGRWWLRMGSPGAREGRPSTRPVHLSVVATRFFGGVDGPTPRSVWPSPRDPRVLLRRWPERHDERLSGGSRGASGASSRPGRGGALGGAGRQSGLAKCWPAPRSGLVVCAADAARPTICRRERLVWGGQGGVALEPP